MSDFENNNDVEKKKNEETKNTKSPRMNTHSWNSYMRQHENLDMGIKNPISMGAPKYGNILDNLAEDDDNEESEPQTDSTNEKESKESDSKTQNSDKGQKENNKKSKGSNLNPFKSNNKGLGLGSKSSSSSSGEMTGMLKKILLKNWKIKLIILAIIATVVSLIFFVVVILGPVTGATIELTNGEGTTETGGSTEENPTPNVDTGDLSSYIEARQKMVTMAYSALGGKYTSNGATSPTLDGIKNGVDCSGFISWVLWGTFGDSRRWTTADMKSAIGKEFIQIKASEMKPGDIGLVRTQNSDGSWSGHTGLYVGNGYYIHASSPSLGIIKDEVSNSRVSFPIILRYYKIPEGS